MKITGLADEQLFILLDKIRIQYPQIDSFIINDFENDDEAFVIYNLIFIM